MRNALKYLGLTSVVALVGCAGPEQKLGRGISNMTEFARLGEIRRSMEQTAMWQRPAKGYTTGFLRGFNRSIARTFIGVYEVVTFPFPSYDPLLVPKTRLNPDGSIATTSYPYGGLTLSENPSYPDNYAPGLIGSSMFDTDSSLGFNGGDVAPMFPGSRFKIFDQ